MEKNNKKINRKSNNFQKNNKNNENLNNFSLISEKNDINFKKSLGQNFIFDTNLLQAICNDGDVSSDDTVLEIGSGAGTLTKILAKNSKKVISFEIDKSLIPILNKIQDEQKNIEFYFEDFMKAEIENLFEGKARVVANIPYYITTPIIFKLVEKIEKFKSILVLVQKEVAERFSATVGTKNYGTTSVILQSIFDVSIPRIVKKECFTPVPKVDSALCKLVPNKKFTIDNFDDFTKFVHLSFSMRRKTLVNNLKKQYKKEDVEKFLTNLNYSVNVRPEEIDVENFVKLFNCLKK